VSARQPAQLADAGGSGHQAALHRVRIEGLAIAAETLRAAATKM
jgi:hypothetical protein